VGALAQAANERPASRDHGSEGARGFEHQPGLWIRPEPRSHAGEQGIAAFGQKRVGWVGKDEVEASVGRRTPSEDIGGDRLAQRGRVGRAEGFGDGGEIEADGGNGGGLFFHPSDVGGATTQGLEAVGAGAGKEVKHARAGDTRGKRGKDRSAEGIRRWAQVAAMGKLELDASGLAAGDAHEQSGNGRGAKQRRAMKSDEKTQNGLR
jgi:hypothetical protein